MCLVVKILSCSPQRCIFLLFPRCLGFSISAARLGLPDTGFISYGEMVDQGQQIAQAVSIPVIGDGDNGYGNAMNVKRTVKGYIRAGFAGIILEDQVHNFYWIMSTTHEKILFVQNWTESRNYSSGYERTHLYICDLKLKYKMVRYFETLELVFCFWTRTLHLACLFAQHICICRYA